MKRRNFLALLGSAAAWPLGVARAQQPVMPVIGFINGGSAEGGKRWTEGFRKGLAELNYTEGQNVAVEYHWLQGQYDGLPALLTDLVHRKVSVIVTPGSEAITLVAQKATSTIPIVFGVAGDPVKLGLVASMAHPGGNITGVNFFVFEVVSKQIGLLHELVPAAKRFALLVNPTNAAGTALTTKQAQDTATTLGLELVVVNATTADEIDAAFAKFKEQGIEALFIAGDVFFASRRQQMAQLATQYRLPAGYVSREMVESGLLMSYGTSIPDMFRQVGNYAGTILKGTTPADLPVVQPTKFELVINLQTAKSLGLKVSQILLAQADAVIE